jgi:hypothetical protein
MVAEKTRSLEKPSRNRSEPSSHARTSPVAASSSRFALVQAAAGNQAIQRAAWARGGGDAHVRVAAGGLNDPQEAEADRVAQMIMNGGTSTSSAGKERVVSHRTESGEASRTASAAFGPTGGYALGSSLRAFFEPHFGDLSRVRIHDDESAAATAASIGARAYTAGLHVGFASGEFAPDTSEGRKLIAHELAHVAQDSAIVRRQPAGEQTAADRPVRGRVRRSDIASRGPAKPDWSAQFDPQKPPADPTDVSSIAEAQAWVKDLSGFVLEEKRRFKIGPHLKSIIERLPPQVWLPTNDVISRSTTKDSTLIVTGTTGPIDTANLRNKLYTMYLSVDRPAELNAPRDATGLIWDFNIEQPADADIMPFQLSREGFTHRDVAVLEFLFADEMLEWRRRDVEVQESVEREQDRRIGVFMAALGEGSIKAIGQFFKYTALAGTGAAAVPGVSGFIAGRFSWIGAEGLASAGWGTRFLVGTGTGEVIGAGTGAIDSAITNLPDVVSGDMDLGDYGKSILQDTWSGAKAGGAFGAAGEVASPFLRRFWNLISPSSKVPPAPAPKPNVATPKPPTPAIRPNVVKPSAPTPPAPLPTVEPNIPATPFQPARTGWARNRLRDLLVKIKLGVAEAEVVPSMQIGYGKGRNAALVEKPAGSIQSPATTPSSPQVSVSSAADEAITSVPTTAAPAPAPQVAAAPAQTPTAPASTAAPSVSQGITLGTRPILVNPAGPQSAWDVPLQAPVSQTISGQLATVPHINAGEIQSLQRISAPGWARITLYATGNRNEFSVKGKIGEELYFASAASQARRDEAVQLAASLNFAADEVQFSTDVRGQTPSRTSSEGSGELGDGMYYAIRNGYLYVLAVVESKSPSNKRELSRKASEGESEHAGQPGWDFERFREVPTTVNGQTFEPGRVLISRTHTRWIGVLPHRQSLGTRSVSHIRTQLPNFQMDNLDVRDSVLNDLARWIISRLPPRQ